MQLGKEKRVREFEMLSLKKEFELMQKKYVPQKN